MGFDNVKAKKLGLKRVPSNARFTVAAAATSVNTVVYLKDFQLESISENVFLRAYLTDGESDALTDAGTKVKWSNLTTFKVVSTTGTGLFGTITAGNTYLPAITCSNGTITFQIGLAAEDYFFLHIISPNGQIFTSPIITTST